MKEKKERYCDIKEKKERYCDIQIQKDSFSLTQHAFHRLNPVKWLMAVTANTDPFS